MAMGKKLIHVVGSLVSVSIIASSVAFGFIPQYERASVIENETTAVEENIENNNRVLAELSGFSDNVDEILDYRDQLRSLVPANPNVPNIQSEIVAALGDFDLVSFTHGPLIDFQPPTAPPLSLGEVPIPFDGSGSEASAQTQEAPVEEPSEVSGAEDTGQNGVPIPDEAITPAPPAGSNVQGVPIVVDVAASGNSAEELTNGLSSLISRIEGSDREMLVLRTTSSISEGDGGNSITAQIHLYSFVSSPGSSQ